MCIRDSTGTFADIESLVEDESIDARVLLVEDNLVNQQVAEAMLKALGCEYALAGNGKEAIDVLVNKRETFDLILMDCQMPVMDGFTATEAIRRDESKEGRLPTPIIALTANAIAGDRERCLAAGMTDYLSKPFSMPQLRKAIRSQLTEAPTALAQGGANTA